MTGWISLHRKIQDHWIWNEKPFDKRSAWIDLILLVNHEDNKILFDNQLKLIKRGQRIISMQQLQDRWGWSNTKVKNFLKLLEEDEMIKLEIAPRKYTIVTIENYSDYQNNKNEKHHRPLTETPQNTHESITEHSQKHINNNDNNDNNDNNENKNTIFSFYEQNGFGLLNKTSSDYLIDLEKEYTSQWLLEAMEEAVKSNARNLNYVKGILKNWKAKGKGNYKGGVSSGTETKRDHEEDREGDFLSKVQDRLRQEGKV